MGCDLALVGGSSGWCLHDLEGFAGAVQSLNRHRVGNEISFSQAISRTLDHLPLYQNGPFAKLSAARARTASLAEWFKHQHFHTGIALETPDQRHAGHDVEILKQRRTVYQAVRNLHPEHWACNIRNWQRVDQLRLNPNTEPPPLGRQHDFHTSGGNCLDTCRTGREG